VLTPCLNCSLAVVPRTPLLQWHRLSGQQLPAGDLQLLLSLIPNQRLDVQHPPTITEPVLSWSRWNPLALLFVEHPSVLFRRPASLAHLSSAQSGSAESAARPGLHSAPAWWRNQWQVKQTLLLRLGSSTPPSVTAVTPVAPLI